MNITTAYTLEIPYASLDLEPALFAARRRKPNGVSQAKRRRVIRWRSNLPKAMQRRLGFKCK